jgi:hypothetical protein
MDGGGAGHAVIGCPELDYVLSSEAGPGEHPIAVRVQDE